MRIFNNFGVVDAEMFIRKYWETIHKYVFGWDVKIFMCLCCNMSRPGFKGGEQEGAPQESETQYKLFRRNHIKCTSKGVHILIKTIPNKSKSKVS